MHEAPHAPALDHDDRAVDHRRHPAAVGQHLAQGGVLGVERAEPDPAGGLASHRQDAGVVGVQHVPARGSRDPRDQALDLRELVDGVDALQVEVVGADVRHHGDVVVPHPDAPQQDAAARGLEHRHVGVGRQGHRGAAEARVVTLLDPSRAAVHAVGRGIRDRAVRRHHEVRQQARRRRLAVRPRDLDHRDRRVGHGRLGAGVRRAHVGGEFGDHPGGRAADPGAQRGGGRASQRLGRARAAARGTRRRRGRACRPGASAPRAGAPRTRSPAVGRTPPRCGRSPAAGAGSRGVPAARRCGRPTPRRSVRSRPRGRAASPRRGS